MSNVAIYFSKNKILENNESINRFEEMKFEIHCFENITYEDIKNVDIVGIIEEISKENEKVYLISNNIEIIANLFEKYSWKYMAFIYDNKLEKNIEYNFSKSTLTYNYNFYCFNEIKTNISYNLIGEDINFLFNQSKLDNFITSAEEFFIDDDWNKNYDLLENKAKSLETLILLLEDKESKNIRTYINLSLKNKNIYYKIYILMFMIKTFKSIEDVKKILKLISIDKETLSIDTKYFLLYQIKNTIFANVIEKDKEVKNLIHCIYDEVYKDYYKNTIEYDFINKKERNEKLIFVFISQFLDLNNGPTKTVLDRIYVLAKKLGKKIVLINSRECLSIKGAIPIYKIDQANVIEKYKDYKSIIYKDIEIPFYQTPYITPDIEEYNNILKMVNQYRPYMVFGIGEIVLACDLCSKIVPTIAVPLGNDIPESFTTFKATYSNSIKYEDKSIINSKFTFDFKKQINTYTRKEFNIPENKFIIGIVGGRLDQEINEEFLNILDCLCNKGLFILFIGGYNLKNKKLKKYNNLLKNSLNLGYQKDVLGILELIDIYLNPKRLGGGTSGLEALYKEKPVVSLNYGDVAAVIGKEFCVNSFYDMKKLVLKYKNDKEFYGVMGKKGLCVAKDLMDTEKYFVQLYNDIIGSDLFV
ncbi:glycosyltransferase [uncultured Clostridium sp.]|uniref:glycosyltransferase n=1 Tax=uncultured Clostridium sp. TaxID=59620 RepID=UPI0025EF88FD|nr:glycosyltransferase family 1 protein [uncultured Clostridium sp.]